MTEGHHLKQARPCSLTLVKQSSTKQNHSSGKKINEFSLLRVLTTEATVSPMEPKATRIPKDLDLSSHGMACENMWKMVGNPEEINAYMYSA